MPSRTVNRPSQLDESAVLAKSMFAAATNLGVTNKLLAEIIGVSEATVSRMRGGNYTLHPGQKPFQLAVLFIRLYRSLDAIVGGDDAVARSWLRNRNSILEDQPLALIRTAPGLMNVLQYLDSRRAIV